MSEDKPDESPVPVPQRPEPSPPPQPEAGAVAGPPPAAIYLQGQGVPVMSDPSAAPAATGRRAPWWLVAVLLVVAVGAGFGAGALMWAGQVEKVYPPGYKALSPEQYDKCVRSVIVYFDSEDPDPVMRAAAEELRDDPRFESVREETRQQAFERFKETFKDQPELVKLARPEALPASVQLMVRKGTTAKQAEPALRADFPDAEVSFQNWCPPPE
jgi:cell division protein FtsX